MSTSEIEELHEKTPQWFRDWHDKAFWHFRYRVESKLSSHDKLLWVILSAIIVAGIASIFL